MPCQCLVAVLRIPSGQLSQRRLQDPVDSLGRREIDELLDVGAVDECGVCASVVDT